MTTNTASTTRPSNVIGLIIAAAFIGPGTVMTATLAGAQSAMSLTWALLFSVVATLTLQDMAARVGWQHRSGLSEALQKQLPSGMLKPLIISLVVIAIGVGNSAYQAGNITGAALGLQFYLPLNHHQLVLLTSAVAAGLLSLSSIERLKIWLAGLVAIMGLMFLLAMIIALPTLMDLSLTNWLPNFQANQLALTLGLIGTTVVPYNLFLHASLVAQARQQQHRFSFIKDAKAISLGGIITLAIMATAASSFFLTGLTPDKQNLANQLSPILGQYAGWVFAIGLFSAGLTSALTAPLAAGYALSGLITLRPEHKLKAVKIIALSVMLIGVFFGLIGQSPFELILIAQVTNAMVLPVIALVLLWLVNQAQMAELRNNANKNALALIVILVVLALMAFKLYRLL